MMGKVILDEEDYSITISGEKKDFTSLNLNFCIIS